MWVSFCIFDNQQKSLATIVVSFVQKLDLMINQWFDIVYHCNKRRV